MGRRERGEDKVDALFSGISQLESLKDMAQSISESLKFLGILSFILVLLFVIITAVIVLAPTLISIIRRTRLRKIIFIANIISIFFFGVNFALPFIIWAVLVIAALIGKREIKTGIDIPTIIINTSSSQIENVKTNRR